MSHTEALEVRVILSHSCRGHVQTKKTNGEKEGTEQKGVRPFKDRESDLDSNLSVLVPVLGYPKGHQAYP